MKVRRTRDDLEQSSSIAPVVSLPLGVLRSMVLGGVALAASLARAQSASALSAQGDGERETLVVGLAHSQHVRGSLEMAAGQPPSGFVVELMRAVAAELGREVSFVEHPFDRSPGTEALRSGAIDLFGLAAVTGERLDQVDFSAPVLLAKGAAYGRKGGARVRSAEDLRGHRLAVAGLGAGEEWCLSHDLPYLEFESLIAAFTSVEEGRADYAITLQNSGRVELERRRTSNFVEHVLDDERIWRSYAFAVARGNRRLVSNVNQALAALHSDGRFDAIYERWMERFQPREQPRRLPIEWFYAATAIVVTGAVAALTWPLALRRELARRTAALRSSEQRHRAVFERSHDGVALLRASDNVVLDLNEHACTLLGQEREAALGRTFALADVVGDAVETSVRSARDERWLELSRSTTEIGGEAVHIVLLRDVTDRVRSEDERQRFETQLFQAQKLEGLGLLAGGIAHDFNNLLVGVTGNIDLALDVLDDPPLARKRMERALGATQRAAELTHQLLAYSGRASFAETHVSLGAVAREMVEILGVSLTDRATIVLELAPELPAVRGDATLIRQVVMNLLTNAHDALGPTGGRVVVRSGVSECTHAFLQASRPPSDIPPGSYVFLEVEDNGCGMDESTLERVFDPFFSTKFAGRGLGLSVAQRAAQRHLGAIKVWSELGRGSRFRLLFPPAGEAAAVERPRVQKTAGSRAGSVLIVDDDALVREVAAAALTPRGWEVSLAADGPSALASTAALELRVVLLDVTMPGMSGFEVLREIRRSRPGLKVVLMSGFAEDVAASESDVAPDGFVAKPFTGDALAAALEAALEPR